MFGFDCLAAWAILSAPTPMVEPLLSPPVFHIIRPAIHSAALRFEILDPREVRYILARPEDFLSDINLLRRRYEDLADAPLLSEGFRFPHADAISQLLAFNRAYRQYLSNRQPLELARVGELREAMRETDDLYQIWDIVRDTRCEYYYITVRRQALKKLRDQLGPEAFYAGRLPPPVPLWRFQEME